MTDEVTTEQQADPLDFYEEKLQYLSASVVPSLKTVLTELNGIQKSKELQLAIMDIESIQFHLDELIDKGGSTPLQEIPLEQSESKLSVEEESMMPADMTPEEAEWVADAEKQIEEKGL